MRAELVDCHFNNPLRFQNTARRFLSSFSRSPSLSCPSALCGAVWCCKVSRDILHRRLNRCVYSRYLRVALSDGGQSPICRLFSCCSPLDNFAASEDVISVVCEQEHVLCSCLRRAKQAADRTLVFQLGEDGGERGQNQGSRFRLDFRRTHGGVTRAVLVALPLGYGRGNRDVRFSARGIFCLTWQSRAREEVADLFNVVSGHSQPSSCMNCYSTARTGSWLFFSGVFFFESLLFFLFKNRLLHLSTTLSTRLLATPLHAGFRTYMHQSEPVQLPNHQQPTSGCRRCLFL